MVNIIINGTPLQVEAGTTILEAAASLGMKIPTLCFMKDCNEIGACRVCVVQIEGLEKLQAACNTVCQEGMVIHTNNAVVRGLEGRPALVGHSYKLTASLVTLNPIQQCQLKQGHAGQEELGRADHVQPQQTLSLL